MVVPTIVKYDELQRGPLMGESNLDGGWMSIALNKQGGTSEHVMFGVAEIEPGFSGHRWHNHRHDKVGGLEINYPKDFEEVYYIVSGEGDMQYKDEEGNVISHRVKAGDTMICPIGIGQHQLLNTGDKTLIMVFCGNKSPVVTPIEK